MSDKPVARRVVDRYREKAQTTAAGMRLRMGPSAGAQKVSRAEAIEMWNFMAPNVDVALVQQALLAGQMTDAQAVNAVYPHRMALIGHGKPKKLVERAEQLAAMAAQGAGAEDGADAMAMEGVTSGGY